MQETVNIFGKESLYLFLLYSLFFVGSIVNLGSVAVFLFFILIFMMRTSPRSCFVVLIMMYYVPDWCIHVPNIYILTTALFVIFNYRKIFNLKRYSKLSPFLLILFSFIILRSFSILWVEDYDWYNYYLQFIVLSFIHVIICCNLLETNDDVWFVARWWGLIAAFSAILGFCHFYYSDIVYNRVIFKDNVDVLSDGALGEGYANWIRWIWAGAEPNYYGLSLLFPFSINTYFLFKKVSLLNLILFTLSVLGIFGTYSRSSLLCAIIVVLLFYSFVKVRRKYFFPLLFVCGITSLFVVFPDFLDRFSSIQDNIKNEGGSGRFNIWKRSLDLIADNLVLGVGTGQVISKAYVTHNTWIQVFAENGVFGILLFLTVYLQPLKKAWSIRFYNPMFGIAIVGVMLNMCTVSCYSFRLDFSLFVMLFTYLHNVQIIKNKNLYEPKYFICADK